MIFVLAIGLIVFIGLAYYAVNLTDTFYNYDWSHGWTDLDKKARSGADCSPLVKIQRKMGNTTTWIWTVPNTCEQGLPHTRSIDVIAIPEQFPHEHLPMTLEHEKIHLLQRQMPDSWARFYKLAWDYDLYTSPPRGMPSELIELRRSNPDTADTPWCCWNSRWWSVPVYKSRTNLSLKDAPIRWWDQTTMTLHAHPPEDWIRFFGSSIHQNEHPHEITAEYLAGPLRNGGIPSGAPEGMMRLRTAWTEDSLYPSIDS